MNYSTRLSAGGYGLVRVCRICNIQYHSFSSCEMKLVSWSVSISLGIPTLANSDTNCSATHSTSVLHIAIVLGT